jgi:hypothetical protein
MRNVAKKAKISKLSGLTGQAGKRPPLHSFFPIPADHVAVSASIGMPNAACRLEMLYHIDVVIG